MAPDIYPLAFFGPLMGYAKAHKVEKWEPGSPSHPVSQLPPSLEPRDDPGSCRCKCLPHSLHGVSKLEQELKNTYLLCGNLAGEEK